MAVIPPSSTPSWYVDPTAYSVISNVNQSVKHKMKTGEIHSEKKPPPYLFAEGGESDYKKVCRQYDKNPVPGCQVIRVRIVYSKSIVGGFEARLEGLNNRGGNPAFQPKWDRNEARQRVHDDLMNRAKKCPNPYGHVKVVSMWHATNSSLIDRILRTNLSNSATKDSELFGKGINLSSNANYVERIGGGDKTLLFTWVSFFSAYPVIDGDRVRGGNNVGNHDVHYVLLSPVNPNNLNEVNYVPTKEGQEHPINKLVVFASNQVLPRYLVELGPTELKLHRLGTITIRALNKAIKISLERSRDPEFNDFLNKKLSQLPTNDLDLALSESENRDFHHIVVFNENQDPTISQVLIEHLLGEVVLKPKESMNQVSDNHFGVGVQDDPLVPAKWYVDGDGDDMWPSEFYQRLADEGNAEAQCEFGMISLGKRNYNTAARFFYLAAKAGDAQAQFNLGDLYAKGKGVQQDYKLAEHFYRLAADQKHVEAQFNLGKLYAKGLGVQQDYKMAKKLYELAADQKHVEAQFNLGDLYAKGERGATGL